MRTSFDRVKTLFCRSLSIGVVAGCGIFFADGCASPPANIPVTPPPNGAYSMYPADYSKPLPDSATIPQPPPPVFDDSPIIEQSLPEEPWFVSVYNKVNRPRIAIFVNRTLSGDLVGIQPAGIYLQSGQYDAALLQQFDYQEIESLLAGWFGAGGQVTLISPDYLRSQLSAQQISNLQSGNSGGLRDVFRATAADVLVQIQAHPAVRNGQYVVLMVGEAVNTQGGQSLAQASVEMPAPVDRYKLNNYTRFLARKLIHDMAETWTNGTPTDMSSAPATNPTPSPTAPPATSGGGFGTQPPVPGGVQ